MTDTTGSLFPDRGKPAAPDVPALPVPPPPPGVKCPRCNGTTMRTFWQTFQDDTRHVRMECGSCGAFVRFLKQTGPGEAGPPPVEYKPKPADAHAEETAPPPDSWQWLGYVRSSDKLWRAVALTDSLGACWDALLTTHMIGDRLCVPVEPRRREKGA